jgi:hypothetical protein
MIHIQYQGDSPITVNLAPALPVLARVKSVRIDGKPQKYSLHESGSFLRVEVPSIVLRPAQQVTFSAEYEGGIAIVPPRPHPQPGEQTSSLKMLDVQSDAQNHSCLVKLTVVGLGGQRYPLAIVSSLPHLRANGLAVHKTDSGFELEIPVEGPNYVTREVCLGD